MMSPVGEKVVFESHVYPLNNIFQDCKIDEILAKLYFCKCKKNFTFLNLERGADLRGFRLVWKKY